MKGLVILAVFILLSTSTYSLPFALFPKENNTDYLPNEEIRYRFELTPTVCVPNPNNETNITVNLTTDQYGRGFYDLPIPDTLTFIPKAMCEWRNDEFVAAIPFGISITNKSYSSNYTGSFYGTNANQTERILFTNTTNDTYNLWAYNQTTPAINYLLSYIGSLNFTFNTTYNSSYEWFNNVTIFQMYNSSYMTNTFNSSYEWYNNATIFQTYNSSYLTFEVDPAWSGNFSDYNAKPNNTYNSTYDTYNYRINDTLIQTYNSSYMTNVYNQSYEWFSNTSIFQMYNSSYEWYDNMTIFQKYNSSYEWYNNVTIFQKYNSSYMTNTFNSSYDTYNYRINDTLVQTYNQTINDLLYAIAGHNTTQEIRNAVNKSSFYDLGIFNLTMQNNTKWYDDIGNMILNYTTYGLGDYSNFDFLGKGYFLGLRSIESYDGYFNTIAGPGGVGGPSFNNGFSVSGGDVNATDSLANIWGITTMQIGALSDYGSVLNWTSNTNGMGFNSTNWTNVSSALATFTTANIGTATIADLTATKSTITNAFLTNITATNITIGANILTTSEFSKIDGIDQTVATTSSPTFNTLTLNGNLNTGNCTTFTKRVADQTVNTSFTVVTLTSTNEASADAGYMGIWAACKAYANSSVASSTDVASKTVQWFTDRQNTASGTGSTSTPQETIETASLASTASKKAISTVDESATWVSNYVSTLNMRVNVTGTEAKGIKVGVTCIITMCWDTYLTAPTIT